MGGDEDISGDDDDQLFDEMDDGEEAGEDEKEEINMHRDNDVA